MPTVLLLIAAIALPGERSTTAQVVSPVSDLRAHVERTLGAKPADCGQFFISQFRQDASAAELRRAVACVAEHAANGTPAWIVVQRQGIDSWIAIGLLVGRDGKVRYYSYDNDPSGGGGTEPRFREGTCGAPIVDDGNKKEPTITCGAPRQ